MTIHEASARYNIPMEILKEYESWALCGAVKQVMGVWQYDDTDIERLSLIMTLHDVGFESAEIETYMKLLLEQKGTEARRLRMLDRKRESTLDEIHSAKSSLSSWIIFGITSASSRKRGKADKASEPNDFIHLSARRKHYEDSGQNHV